MRLRRAVRYFLARTGVCIGACPIPPVRPGATRRSCKRSVKFVTNCSGGFESFSPTSSGGPLSCSVVGAMHLGVLMIGHRLGETEDVLSAIGIEPVIEDR